MRSLVSTVGYLAIGAMLVISCTDDTKRVGSQDDADATGADTSADVADVDTARDTARLDIERDTANPQADAWKSTWERELLGTDARVLGLRYIGGQSGAGLLVAFEVGTGEAKLDAGDGEAQAIPGDGRRLVLARLDPDKATLTAVWTVALGEGENVGEVLKGPNGLAVAVSGAESRVLVAQAFGVSLRIVELTVVAESGAPSLNLPKSGDLAVVTSGGASTPLAVAVDASGPVTLRASAFEAIAPGAEPAEPSRRVSLPAPGKGLAFVTFAAPTADALFPEEGCSLAFVEGFAPAVAYETRSGSVVTGAATASTSVGERTLEAGQKALLVGAVQEDGTSVPVILWQSSNGSALDVLQVSSGGQGGLVIAGTGKGEVQFGPDTLGSAEMQDFIASIGTTSGILYTAPPCDHILAANSGFQYRVLKTTCDAGGDGPALVLTLLTTDFAGNLQDPIDLTLALLPEDGSPKLLSGLVSFTVQDGRAYGALVDLGDGPRLVLARQDGQPYDSGVLPSLRRTGAGDAPVFFQTMRTGGGGGGGGSNALTNAIVYATPQAGGVLIGRARVDLLTFIW